MNHVSLIRLSSFTTGDININTGLFVHCPRTYTISMRFLQTILSVENETETNMRRITVLLSRVGNASGHPPDGQTSSWAVFFQKTVRSCRTRFVLFHIVLFGYWRFLNLVKKNIPFNRFFIEWLSRIFQFLDFLLQK